MSEDSGLIIPGKPQEAHRLPTELPAFNSINGPDYIFEDIRFRFLNHVRAHAMGNKSVRVDVGPVTQFTPQGPITTLLLAVSIPAATLGERIMTSVSISAMEPNDQILGDFARDLYNAAMDRRQEQLQDRG